MRRESLRWRQPRRGAQLTPRMPKDLPGPAQAEIGDDRGDGDVGPMGAGQPDPGARQDDGDVFDGIVTGAEPPGISL
jgi:hypothetical protein